MVTIITLDCKITFTLRLPPLWKNDYKTGGKLVMKSYFFRD